VPVTVARERGVIPEASNETLEAFSFSEMKLYKHAIAYKWTAEELTATIKLIKSRSKTRLPHRDGTPRDRCKAEYVISEVNT
jgi:hypothetical protein